MDLYSRLPGTAVIGAIPTGEARIWLSCWLQGLLLLLLLLLLACWLRNTKDPQPASVPSTTVLIAGCEKRRSACSPQLSGSDTNPAMKYAGYQKRLCMLCNYGCWAVLTVFVAGCCGLAHDRQPMYRDCYW